MATDRFYGQGAELRVGPMANPTTDPTTWFNLEFVSLSMNPGRAEQDRPLLGAPLHNPIDTRDTVPGLTRLDGQIVVPADTRQLARWLALGMGAPTTSGSGPTYTHAWASGSIAPQYFALQIRSGANDVRIYRGLTISSIALEAEGEAVDNFNVTLGLRGLTDTLASSFLGASATAVPTPAPVRRVVFTVDGVSSARTEQASYSYDRQVADNVFLSQNPSITELEPAGGVVTGSARFRATGRIYDEMERARQTFAAGLLGYGRATGHELRLRAPQARFAATPLAIDGPGQVVRSWNWGGYQTADQPAARIEIVNDVASYA